MTLAITIGPPLVIKELFATVKKKGYIFVSLYFARAWGHFQGFTSFKKPLPKGNQLHYYTILTNCHIHNCQGDRKTK